MRSTYLRLYVHFVWSTWKRQEFIDKDLELILYRLINDKVIENKSRLLAFGCTSDHVHLLVKIHPTMSVSKIVKEIKGYSSFTIANKIRPGSYFRWQSGNGAMTISQSDITRLTNYINNQKEHHNINQMDDMWGT